MMKKITLLMLTLVSLSLSAQVYYSEDFEAETVDTEPSTFTVYNEDTCIVNNNPPFTNQAWIVSDNGDAQGQYAAAQSWSAPVGCMVDDWLITPSIDLTAASANTSLTWVGRSSEGPTYSETYEVRVSTTGTAIADFTTLVTTIDPELEDWTPHSESMAAFAGQTIHVAFRLISADQSQGWIDDIIVSEPAARDMAIAAVNSNGVPQTSAFSAGQFLIVDFSERTNFVANVDLLNVGTDPLDTAFLSYFLLDDAFGAPTAGVSFGDTVVLSPPLASGATYTHTFEGFGLDTLFPGLAPNQVLDFIVQIDSSDQNLVADALDFNYEILVAPAESYSAPYSSSFEVADLNAGQFLFDHTTWGWKYLDNDQDDISLNVGQQFTNLPAQDGSMQLYGSVIGNTLSLGADDDVAESPELSLTAGSAYSFSVYARTGFGQTGAIDMILESIDGAYLNTLGTVNLTGADSIYTKYSFNLIAPSTQTDYKVSLEKNTTGFILLDLFELEELQLPTANLNLSSSSTDEPGVEYCDSMVTVTFNASGNPSSMSLDWGDGTVDDVTGLTQMSHTYSVYGSYTIVLSATNILGTGTDDVALDFTAQPAPVVTFGTPSVSGETVTVTVGTGVGSNVVYTPECARIIMDWGDGTIEEITGMNAVSHTYTTGGTFTIEATVIGSSQATAETDVVITIGINDLTFVNELNIFPNPSNAFVNVSFELNANEDVEVAVYSVTGKIVEAISFTDAKEVNTTFNTSELNNGVYLMKITTESGVSTQKFVVSHN